MLSTHSLSGLTVFRGVCRNAILLATRSRPTGRRPPPEAEGPLTVCLGLGWPLTVLDEAGGGSWVQICLRWEHAVVLCVRELRVRMESCRLLDEPLEPRGERSSGAHALRRSGVVMTDALEVRRPSESALGMLSRK